MSRGPRSRLGLLAACVAAGCHAEPSLQRAEQTSAAAGGSAAATSADNQQGLLAIGGGTRLYAAGDPWPFRIATAGAMVIVIVVIILLHARAMSAAKDARIKGYHEQRMKRLKQEQDDAGAIEGYPRCPRCGWRGHHAARHARDAETDRARLHGRRRDRAAGGQPAGG